ncbi:MAG TPA: PIG-L family deacetylase [Pyrinomonadaceae bacterium]|nr:PIG-L family deacetylase [Pyrinomonadaceae bacterium]
MWILGESNRKSYELSCGTLLLAPHCDDIAFAIGGHLLHCALPGPVTIATVFTRSNYTLAHGFRNPADVVTAIRKSEERSFLDSIGAAWIDCDLPEGSLRGYSTLREIFGGVKTHDAMVNQVDLVFREMLTCKRGGMIGLPVGLGNHVDHLIVRDLAKIVLEMQDIELFFYEELPYAVRCTEGEIHDVVKMIAPRAIPHLYDISTVLNEKVQAISNYRSQVGPEELDAVCSYAARLDTNDEAKAFERIWMTRP